MEHKKTKITVEFIYFLGRLHVLVLHLPIGIIIAVILLEVVSRKPGYESLATAANFLWGLAAATAVGTMLLGMMHAQEGGFEGPSLFYHRIFGIATAVVTTLVWIVRITKETIYLEFQNVFWGIILFLVVVTGHYGGTLTHGPDYLLDFSVEKNNETKN